MNGAQSTSGLTAEGDTNTCYEKLLQPDPAVDQVLCNFRETFTELAIAQVGHRVIQCSRRCLEDAGLLTALQPGAIVTYVPAKLTPEFTHTEVVLPLHVVDDVRSTTDMFQTFRRAHEAADRVLASGGLVMFVCEAGQSRSGTGAISYLMKRTGLPMELVLAHVISRKPNADPNDGFRQLLRAFETRTIDEALRADPESLYAEPLAVQPIRQADLARRLSLILLKNVAECLAALEAAGGDYNVALDALLQ